MAPVRMDRHVDWMFLTGHYAIFEAQHRNKILANSNKDIAEAKRRHEESPDDRLMMLVTGTANANRALRLPAMAMAVSFWATRSSRSAAEHQIPR